MLTLAVAALLFGLHNSPAQATPEPAHISNSFQFQISAPFARVAPLFGPEAERNWSGKHWNPVFLYPRQPQDIEGAVFTVQHGDHTAVWVNTAFDLAAGRMQYVYFIPDGLVTTIDVRVTSIDASHTAVRVTYVRTALQPSANDLVQSMGNNDRTSGPEWKSAIDDYLKIH